MADARPNVLLAGLLARCPNCGRGPLFAGFLRVHERCPTCGEPLAMHGTDDGPAYFVMFFVGIVVVAGALMAEIAWAWPIVWHLVVWLPLTILLSLALLRPVKGLMLAIQYKTRASGGREPV